MQRVDEIIEKKLAFLRDNNVDTSIFELKVLMAEVLGIEVGSLRFYDEELSDDQYEKFLSYVEMRKNFMPVDKIIGKKCFYKLDFNVNEDVLSPRYDTEILIDEILSVFNADANIDILEFGTGSGCIIISLLDELKNAKGWGVELSKKAFDTTNNNAEKNKVSDRLTMINNSWFEELDALKSKKFDLIVSNPPYIPGADICNLDKEVRLFDPLLALDGGDDGLRDYIKISSLAKQMLKKDGYLVFEVGFNQADDVVDIGEKNGLQFVKTAKDYNGINRCVILKKTV